jgi:hypothetical protein
MPLQTLSKEELQLLIGIVRSEEESKFRDGHRYSYENYRRIRLKLEKVLEEVTTNV